MDKSNLDDGRLEDNMPKDIRVRWENGVMHRALPILERHNISSLFSYRYAFMLGYKEALMDIRVKLENVQQ
jgi:hypothetical protein